MITSFKNVFFLSVISATLACNGAPSAMTVYPVNTQSALTKISASDWQHLLNSDRSVQQKVAWKIKITDVSYFGGFYVKGHILDTKSAKVHLTWPPETTPSGSMRDSLVVGGIITITGNLEGVTAEREALISVTQCMR